MGGMWSHRAVTTASFRLPVYSEHRLQFLSEASSALDHPAPISSSWLVPLPSPAAPSLYMGPDLPSPSVLLPPPPASCPGAPLLQEAFLDPDPQLGLPFTSILTTVSPSIPT